MTPDEAGGASGRFRHTLGPFMVLAAQCFLIYSSTLNAGWVWDDHKLITINVHRGQGAGVVKLWTRDFWQSGSSQYYRPLTAAAFLLDHRLYGESPRGYHLTNIILYAGVCCLAYILFLRLLRPPALAFALAALFAGLPAHTENAAWVSGRTDLISALFMFAALVFYLRREQTGRALDLVLALALFALSLFGKEASIILAGVVALREVLERGPTRRALLNTLPFAAVALAFILAHSLAAPRLQEENIYAAPGAYAANVLRNLGLGVWRSLVPGGYEYIITATRDEAARCFPAPGGVSLALAATPLAAAVAGVILALRRKQKLMALALASGLMALVPVSGIVPIGVVFALRFLLIPSFFFILFIGLALEQLSRMWAPGKIVFPAGLAALALAYSALSFVQAANWKDDVRLMSAVIAKAPEATMAHLLLGNGLAGQGRGLEAMESFERALELRPEYAEAEYNLGALLERQGRTGEAEIRYRRVMEYNPGFAPAREALIGLLLRSGREGEAERTRIRPPGP